MARIDGTTDQCGPVFCWGVHPRARGEVAEGAVGVHIGGINDSFSVVRVFSPEIPFDRAALEK